MRSKSVNITFKLKHQLEVTSELQVRSNLPSVSLQRQISLAWPECRIATFSYTETVTLLVYAWTNYEDKELGQTKSIHSRLFVKLRSI